jgi:hypothetical protein
LRFELFDEGSITLLECHMGASLSCIGNDSEKKSWSGHARNSRNTFKEGTSGN